MQFWPLTYISALVLVLSAYQRTSGVLRENRALVSIGQVSMPLFFVNGFLRDPFWAIGGSGVWHVEIVAGLGFAIVSLAVAYGLSWVARRLAARGRRPVCGRQSPRTSD
jgi:hypothetical protein